jgi:hypothetical protein
MRAVFTDPAVYPDALLWSKIVEGTKFVDVRTQQFFAARYEKCRIDAKENSIIHRDDLVPMLKVESVSMDLDKTTGEVRVADEMLGARNLPFGFVSGGIQPLDLNLFGFMNDNRIMRCSAGILSRGAGNIIVKGFFGWLDPIGKYIDTTLAASLKVDDTVIVLNAVESDDGRIEIGDFINVILKEPTGGAQGLLFQPIAQAVDYATKTITVDKISAGLIPAMLPLPAGMRVVVVGAPPVGIQNVVEYLATKFVRDAVSGGGVPLIDPNRIKKETTDNYSYELDSSGSDAAALAGYGAITGDAQMDAILATFAQPPYWGYA